MIKKMYIGLHVQYPLFLPIFVKIEISRKFWENIQKSNFMKLRLWEPSCSVTKLIVAFLNLRTRQKMNALRSRSILL